MPPLELWVMLIPTLAALGQIFLGLGVVLIRLFGHRLQYHFGWAVWLSALCPVCPVSPENEQEEAWSENLDFCMTFLTGMLSLCIIRSFLYRHTPTPTHAGSGTKRTWEVNSSTWRMPRHCCQEWAPEESFVGGRQMTRQQPPQQPLQRLPGVGNNCSETKSRWIIVVVLSAVATVHVALDAHMYFGHEKGHENEHRCVLGFDAPWKSSLAAALQLVCVVCSNLTQGCFQIELMRTLTLCEMKIDDLKSKWDAANDRDRPLDEYRDRPLDEYRDRLVSCRRYVKALADHWFWLLAANVVIHCFWVFFCALQILLRLFFYNQREDKTTSGWIDDPHGAMWYAVLACLDTVQLLLYLPRLCSINDSADGLGQHVVERFKQHSAFSWAELDFLIKTCPVSFPILGVRLSWAQVSAALVAAILSMLGLGLTTAEQQFLPPTEYMCTCKFLAHMELGMNCTCH